MNSDLIVMTFADGEMAQLVYNSLQAMRKSQILGLGDSVILTRDGSRKIQRNPGSSTNSGLAELLAQIVFPSPDREIPSGTSFRLDDQFVQPVASALCENGSALLFFVQSDSLSDTGELIHALALFRGTIYQTTLSPQDEAVLRRIKQSARVFT